MFSPEVLQIIRFGLVGVWNTVFDLCLFFLFYRILDKRIAHGVRVKAETIAHMCSFLIANTVSYQLNSRFTFNTDGSGSRFLPYFLISLLSLGLSSLIINFLASDMYFDKCSKLTTKILPPYKLNRPHYAIGIKIFAVAVVMTVNYIGYKYIVFGG